MADEVQPRLGRRELIAGGLLAGAAATAAMTSEAEARSSIDASGVSAPQGSPFPSTIASTPITGYVYQHAFMFDFTPENPNARRAWGGNGVYTQGAATLLWAALEIPPRGLVRDIEWYVSNDSGAPVTGAGRLWGAGRGALVSTVADVSIPVGSGITATRRIVPESSWGPYPPGTKLALSVRTPTDASVQINGVRVGFSIPRN